jgi:hypothetical protein
VSGACSFCVLCVSEESLEKHPLGIDMKEELKKALEKYMRGRVAGTWNENPEND